MIEALSTEQVQRALTSSKWKTETLRETPTRDLLDRLEAWQYTRLADIDHDGTRQYCELKIDEIRAELTWRRKLLARAQASDPYAPKWPSKEDREARLQQRIEAAKRSWPIDRFCSEVMFADLKPVGGGKFVCCCPFPDHDDSTPSFHLYPNNSAFCFGCQRGGDIISLAQIYFQTTRFIDTLETLEALGSTGRMAS